MNEADILIAVSCGDMTRDEACEELMSLGWEWFDAQAAIDTAERTNDE